MSDEVAGALERSQAAKAAYREDSSEDARAAHRAASEDLRYARWVARGGPAQHEDAVEIHEGQARALADAGFAAPPPPKAIRTSQVHYDRWLSEKKGR